MPETERLSALILTYKYNYHMKKNKNKKPRDVSYSQGYQLIQQHGLETVRET
jgi:hypothetical protein